MNGLIVAALAMTLGVSAYWLKSSEVEGLMTEVEALKLHNTALQSTNDRNTLELDQCLAVNDENSRIRGEALERARLAELEVARLIVLSDNAAGQVYNDAIDLRGSADETCYHLDDTLPDGFLEWVWGTAPDL